MITMTEIAKLTGVSQPTVSRVLNGNTNVKPEVREKVMACAKAHNYQPNILAQGLTGSKTHLLGVIIPDISNPFFADIIRVLEAEASRLGYSLLLFNTDYDVKKENNYLDILRRYRVDGLLLIAAAVHDEAQTDIIRGYETPKVIVTQQIKGIDSVFISHYEAGRKIARHLISLGYSSFIYSGNENDEKERGYRDELTEAGIDLDNHYLAVRLRENPDLSRILSQRFEAETDSDGIGIFAYNDVQALIVLSALQDSGIRVPQQAALVGFDNTYISKEASPRITSLAQPVEEIGRLAVERIEELIQGRNREDTVHLELDTRMVVRASTVKVTRTIHS